MSKKSLLFCPYDLIDNSHNPLENTVRYWYEGICPGTGKLLRLPRTLLSEKIAVGLMQQLKNEAIYAHEGKMYGVLLVETNQGKLGVIKAFSGLLNGQSNVTGWVPQIPGKSLVALAENFTLSSLEDIKQEILNLQQLPERGEYQRLLSEYELIRQEINIRHQQSQQKRHQQRKLLSQTLAPEKLSVAIKQLEAESRRDGMEKRNLKRHWHQILQPLKDSIARVDQRIRELKHQRQQLSRQLQSQMQAAYTLTNFAGHTISLSQLMAKPFIPTGTGDCCAPKLLHYAATHSFKPIAMAEFWWGKSSPKGNKVVGNFYGACVERCQPLMGFLLSGLPTPSISISNQSIPLVYEDESLMVINKPSGLLSVAGRGSNNFDSVESRLRQKHPHLIDLKAVHRLDQDTSGLLILAKNLPTYQNLSLQFQEKKVTKIYEAILAGNITQSKGTIDLPLWGNPQHRPLQEVNWHKGKPSVTHFQVIHKTANDTRIKFFPVTGRTHQIRVHASSPQGLGVPIKGDRFYGIQDNSERLYLHARKISFQHPNSSKTIDLEVNTPFY